MSQYGASMLGLSGWKFDQILNSYYSNMQLQTANGQPFEVQSLELSGLSPMNQEETRQAQVTAVYNDGSRVIWTSGVKFTSSNPAVASVSKSGVVTALSYGQTEITASYGSKTVSYKLAVASKVASLELSGLEPMVTGESRQTHVTAVKVDGTRASLTEGVTFTSSNPEAAVVDAAGWVNAVGHGQTIIAAVYEGRTASYALEVSPALTGLSIVGPQSMKEAEKGQTVVSATYSDGKIVTVTEGVTYSSSNPAVATIDQAGVVTAVGMGETVITAAFSGKSAEYRLNVTATLTDISISKLKQMKAGETEKVTVFAIYSDNSSNEVTAGISFSSSDPNVASIDSAGNLHAIGKGHTMITVTYAGKTTSEKLGVQKAKNPNDSNDDTHDDNRDNENQDQSDQGNDQLNN
jgi:proteasome assembly chaperone (PAC2) family protein